MTVFPAVKCITTREEYDAANRVILEILESGRKKARSEEFDLLSLLCDDYSRRVSPWLYEKSKSYEMLEFFMEQHDLSQADLVPVFGSASAVSLVLSGKRLMTMPVAKALRERFKFDFPALLASEYEAKPPRKTPVRKRAKRKTGAKA